MYRIDNVSAVTPIPTPAAPGPVPDGFYQSGTTIVDADHLNAMQEELAYAIEQSPGTPALSKTDRTQLKTAIDAYIAAADISVGVLKSMIYFDGTGTIAIIGSQNVASIDDNGGAGDYTVNFTDDMDTATYTALATCNGLNDNNAGTQSAKVYGMAVGSCSVRCVNESDNGQDCEVVMLAIFE